MSVKIMGLVWDLNIDPKEKYVLLAYADHADHEGKSIYPAIASVAKKTGYSERSVQRITRELENKGLLQNAGLGPRGTKRWYIPVSRGVILSPQTGVILSPQGCQNLHRGVTKTVERGDIAVSPESSLTIINHPLTINEKNPHQFLFWDTLMDVIRYDPSQPLTSRRKIELGQPVQWLDGVEKVLIVAHPEPEWANQRWARTLSNLIQGLCQGARIEFTSNDSGAGG